MNTQKAREQCQLVQVAKKDGETGVHAKYLNTLKPGRNSDDKSYKVSQRSDGDAHARLAQSFSDQNRQNIRVISLVLGQTFE